MHASLVVGRDYFGGTFELELKIANGHHLSTGGGDPSNMIQFALIMVSNIKARLQYRAADDGCKSSSVARSWHAVQSYDQFFTNAK